MKTNSTNVIAAKPTLVLGGTGKTGRSVADRLTALGHPVRIGSRSADPRFDWQEPATWQSALAVTGPQLISFAEATAQIAAATDRDIAYRSVGVEEFAAELVEAGLSGEDAFGLSRLLAEVLDGRNAYTTDGVRQALGREPRDFPSYVAATAATGVWAP